MLDPKNPPKGGFLCREREKTNTHHITCSQHIDTHHLKPNESKLNRDGFNQPISKKNMQTSNWIGSFPPLFFVGEVKKTTPSSNKFNHQQDLSTSSLTWITTEDHRSGPRFCRGFCRGQQDGPKARKQQRVPPCHGVGREEFCCGFSKSFVFGHVSWWGEFSWEEILITVVLSELSVRKTRSHRLWLDEPSLFQNSSLVWRGKQSPEKLTDFLSCEMVKELQDPWTPHTAHSFYLKEIKHILKWCNIIAS